MASSSCAAPAPCAGGQRAAFAVTGYGAEEDVRRGREAGFIGHFVKPIDLRALEDRIRELLGSPAIP